MLYVSTPTVSSPVWLSSHSSSCANMLCLQGSWWFSELLQVPWGLLLLEWQPWLKVFSQIPAGGWTILRPTSGSCGSSEPIQAPQFHECYGWHSSLPHYRTSPLSCSWIHSSPWLAVPHMSPLLVGHLRTFINWAVFSGRWRSMILMALNRNMLSFRRLFRAPWLQSLHNIRWDWSWAQLLSNLPFD